MDPIFYFEKKENGFIIPEDEKHHMDVLRIKLPSDMLFTDGMGRLYRGRIDAGYNVISYEGVADSKKEEVNIYFGVCEKGRMKFILEKCTELGAASFTPVFTKKSDRYPIGRERAESILLSAIKQSRRFLIPEYREPIELAEIPEKTLDGIIFGAIKGGKRHLDASNAKTDILIGPPSGFTEDEETFLIEKGALPFYFETAVLRTETFAVSLLSIIHYLKGAENE